MNRQKTALRVLALFFAALLLLPLATACRKRLDENEIAVTWNHGMVTSAAHLLSPETLLEGADGYSYSDIIHIEKAGTTLSFCDYNDEKQPDTERADGTVYVISHWVEENGTWVLDTPGDHYEGREGRSAEIARANTEENYVKYTYTSSFDNEYVRLCYRSGQTAKNARKINFPRVYAERLGETGTLVQNEKFYRELRLEKYLKASRAEAWYESLAELDIVVIGDSYFDDGAVRDRLWIDLLGYKYDMEIYNHGISGSTVSDPSGTITNADHTYYGKKKGESPMTERLTDKNAKKALTKGFAGVDIVLFDGGRNDFTREAPIGEASLENTSTANFCGALNYCFDRLQEMFPNALIIGITVWGHEQTNPVTGHTQEDFGNAMIEICRLQGIPCFNGMDESVTGVHMDDPLFRQQYCKGPKDVSHLSEAGMMKFMPVMEKFLATEYAAHLAK